MARRKNEEKKEATFSRTFYETKAELVKMEFDENGDPKIVERVQVRFSGKLNVSQVAQKAKDIIKEHGGELTVLPRLEYEEVVYEIPISEFIKHATIRTSTNSESVKEEGV